MTDLAIRNSRVLTPAGDIYGGVAAEDGKIIYVGADSGFPWTAHLLAPDGVRIELITFVPGRSGSTP